MEDLCDSCEHRNDSSTEYCGVCEGKVGNYKEAGWIKDEKISSLEQKVKELEAEVERIKYLDVAIEAWFSVFGTRQLSHAQAKMEALKQENTSLQARVEELEKALWGIVNHDCDDLGCGFPADVAITTLNPTPHIKKDEL